MKKVFNRLALVALAASFATVLPASAAPESGLGWAGVSFNLTHSSPTQRQSPMANAGTLYTVTCYAQNLTSSTPVGEVKVGIGGSSGTTKEVPWGIQGVTFDKVKPIQDMPGNDSVIPMVAMWLDAPAGLNNQAQVTCWYTAAQ